MVQAWIPSFTLFNHQGSKGVKMYELFIIQPQLQLLQYCHCILTTHWKSIELTCATAVEKN